VWPVLSLSLSLIVLFLISEAALAKPRPPLPPMPENVLNLWRFDTTAWQNNPDQAPLLARHIGLAESWSGYAVTVAGWDPAQLIFPAVAPSGHVNLNPAAGTLRFWFNPYWSSAGLGGQGTGDSATLLEIGAWSNQGAVGWWTLQISPDGRGLALVANGAAKEQAIMLLAPMAWSAGQWHQISLTYSAESSALYVDGIQAATGPGLALVPLITGAGTVGMAVGSDVLGNHLAQGEFDELTTLAYPQSPGQIALHYDALKNRAALGPISLEEEAQREALMLTGLEAALTQKAGRALMETLESVTCTELRLNLDPQSNGTLRLTICGGKEGAVYDLYSLDDLNLSKDWTAWEWECEMTAEDEVFVSPTGPARFYQVAEVLDQDHIGPVTFYVSPNGVTGADGSRDLPSPASKPPWIRLTSVTATSFRCCTAFTAERPIAIWISRAGI
jgi:Concanavalin A-like lectin/glucanases superfamily